MFIRQLSTPADLAAYDTWVKTHPEGSLWQSLEWKRYQEALGRETRIYVGNHRGGDRIRASALVTIDRTAGGYSTWDIGRGPLWNTDFDVDDACNFFHWIDGEAKMDKCIQIFCSPHTWQVKYGPPSFGFGQTSRRHVYPEATVIIDVRASEEELLRRMHPKGRYNIKVAQKNGVVVRQSDDVASYAALARQTAARDGFKGPSEKQYGAFLRELPGAFLMMAYEAKSDQRSATSRYPLPAIRRPIAGLIGIIWPGSAGATPRQGIYYYGASDYEHRSLMAPYLLQWEAMKYCKAKGCTKYDLLGIAPQRATDEHPWQGISDFKAKFGGTVVTYPAEQEIVLRPWVKVLLQIKRRIIG